MPLPRFARSTRTTIAATTTAALLLSTAPAPATALEPDASSEALSSLASFGFSILGALATSGARLADTSSKRPGPAQATEPGQLGDKTKVPGAPRIHRISYSTTKENGQVVSTTGAIYDTPNAKGLIALAPGTRGMGNQCAPSAPAGMFLSITDGSVNVNYETPVVRELNKAGYRVVVIDYIGLGSEGTHTYLNRVEQAHALIDAARATAKPNEKIGFWGYSQGGGAAAAAAELVNDYAPELNVVGTFAGAPPADPIAVLEQAPEGITDVVASFAAVSFASTYPEFDEALSAALTDEGKEVLAGLGQACILDGQRALPKPFAAYTTDGRTLAQIARADDRIMRYLDHNKLGTVAPTSPIMVLTNPDDDLVPEPQATQLARDYCALDAPVEYRSVIVPGTATMPLYTKADLSSALIVNNTPTAGHATPLVLETKNAAKWMDERFAGEPFDQKCPGETGTVVLNPDDDPTDVEVHLNQVEIAAIVLGTLTAITGLALGGAYQAFTTGLLDPFLDPQIKAWLTAVLP
ncbi:lipase family protein [Corynebacterium sp. TA-R-1]|uniref:Lipase family protein n=1 Tax=Corynebacterium stercoris TaxID=2943490 RepID=A0ABT1G3Z2_9CORY|nr:alpha/beta fold hydrolase [Corynebacterium stercoris]MCP1388710.1 lipase family protein [Corynebacterium stercoris]